VAAEEAKRYDHPYVEIEHLFLALLRVEESLAARILIQP
jgi:ATP-dependent Clp protease ATP-binding subunit ClpA